MIAPAMTANGGRHVGSKGTTERATDTTTGVAPQLELARLQLVLRAGGRVQLTAPPTRALHGVLYRALGAVDADDGATAVASANTPFALSLLYRTTGDGDVPVRDRLEPGERVRLTIGAFEPRAVAGLTTALRELWRTERPLLLDWTPLRVESSAIVPLSGPRWPPATYGDLLLAAVPAELITLQFVSPTLFRHKGRAILTPEPRLVFGSAWRRWQEYAPPLVSAETMAQLLDQITLVERHLELTTFGLGPVEHRAFTGRAIYRIGGTAEQRKVAAALADYLVYCGTGSRTAYGMGETRYPGGLWAGS